MDYGMIIYLIHMSGKRVIAQGTDGCSCGFLMEGVVAGEDMGWYDEGHRITGGQDDTHGVWIPTHGPSDGLFFSGCPHLTL